MKHHQIPLLNPELTIGWLYPELMSTYGDRGNIMVLRKIAENHNINVEILRINQNSDANSLTACDLIFMGGAQDLQQEIVNRDLLSEKGKILTKKIHDGIPGLYICGAYQFLGNYYKDAYGTTIKGLGVFDMHTESSRINPRLIGSIVASTTTIDNLKPNNLLVGFENHGGRTYLGKSATPFAKVIRGHGNNGDDKTEGIHFKNSFGTYLHGPILPSNPEIAIHLLELALEIKYSKKVSLIFDDQLSRKAKDIILNRLNV